MFTEHYTHICHAYNIYYWISITCTHVWNTFESCTEYAFVRNIQTSYCCDIHSVDDDIMCVLQTGGLAFEVRKADLYYYKMMYTVY